MIAKIVAAIYDIKQDTSMDSAGIMWRTALRAQQMINVCFPDSSLPKQQISQLE